MRFRLLCVGKPKEATLAQLHDRYAERLRRLNVGYEADWVPDVRPTSRLDDESLREREARLLLDRLDGKGTLVALDSRGDLVRSDELAKRFERYASPRCTVIVGGPAGLHRDLLDRSDWIWSLSPLTFPHELVRGLVAEQLYRAVTILRGTPYHK